MTIIDLVTQRLGGSNFDKGIRYKFEKIKSIKKRLEESGKSILDFGIGEPYGCPPEIATKTLSAACSEKRYNQYADNGASFFKESVARFMKKYYQVECDAERNILPILGIKSGLTLLAGVLIDPDDYVVTTVPGYPVFEQQSRFFGGKIIQLPLLPEHNFLPQLSSIPENILRKIKVLSINYPNNPTGATATREFFESCVEFAKRYDCVVVQDAAYGELTENPISIMNVSGAEDCCVELHSMSKGFSMTGWRLGWMCGNETLLRVCSFYKNFCDSGQFLAIQKACAESLENYSAWLPEKIAFYKQRLQAILLILNKLGFSCYASQAGFYVYVKVPNKVFFDGSSYVFDTALDFSNWLAENFSVITVPWDEAGSFVRFSLTFEGDETSTFKELKELLSRFTVSYNND